MLNQVNNWLLAGGGIRKIAIFLVLLFGVSGCKELALRIRNLHRDCGSAFTVAYLKECVRVVQHFVSGRPVPKTVGPPFVGLRSGLPRILPANLRSGIREGRRDHVMVSLTLLGIYRGLIVPPNVKVETITDGYTGECDHLLGFSDTVSRFVAQLHLGKLSRPRLWLSTSVGPHGLTGGVSAIKDARSLLNKDHSTIWLFMKSYCRAVYGWRQRVWLEIMVRYFATVHWILFPQWVCRTGETSWLSRLHRIEEPAGKVRIVAITDYWTQFLLKPVHDLVFGALRNLPQDGTFDQEACVDRVSRRVREIAASQNGVAPVFSFDLSSATDRMPVHLYQELLSHILGDFEAATLWKHLLTARKWWDRDSAWTPDEGLVPEGAWKPRMYAVGQPMGAYSSWAMLALAHHALVQYTHGLLGRQGWFEDYAIVGDDIVILDPSLADRYREVLTELGVQISMEKSLVSERGVYEFCKRLVTPEGDVTGMPVKLLFQAFKYPLDVPVLIRQWHRRGFTLFPIAVTRAVASLTARSVDLRKSIRTYPVSIRIALATLVQPAFPWWRGIWLLVHILRLSPEELQVLLQTGGAIPTDQLGAYGKLETTSFNGWLARLRPGKWSDSLLKVSPGIVRMLLKSRLLTELKKLGFIRDGTWGPIQAIILWGTPLGWWLISDIRHRLWVLLGQGILSWLESMSVPGEMRMMSGYIFFRKRFRDRVLASYQGSGTYLGAIASARTQPTFELTFFPCNDRKERRRRRLEGWTIRCLRNFPGTLPPGVVENLDKT